MTTSSVTVDLGLAVYLGGIPGQPADMKGRLWLDDERVGFGSIGASTVVIDTASIASVEVDTIDVVKSKVPATLAFGVLGALAARESARKTAVTMQLHDGAVAYFRLEIDDLPTARQKMTPWLQSLGLLGSAPPGRSLASDLDTLARLHGSGALSDAEFTAAKAKLLA